MILLPCLRHSCGDYTLLYMQTTCSKMDTLNSSKTNGHYPILLLILNLLFPADFFFLVIMLSVHTLTFLFLFLLYFLETVFDEELTSNLLSLKLLIIYPDDSQTCPLLLRVFTKVSEFLKSGILCH